MFRRRKLSSSPATEEIASSVVRTVAFIVGTLINPEPSGAQVYSAGDAEGYVGAARFRSVGRCVSC